MSCGCRNVKPLVCHGIVTRLGVENDPHACRRDFVEKVNHHANWTGCSLDEDFEIVRRKHDLG